MSKVKKSKWSIDKIDKIYHVSDIHIRNYKRQDEYRRVFDNLYAKLRSKITENDIVCLTGDIVHSKTDVSPELFQEVQDFLKNLCSISKVLMIPGNHDTNLNNVNRMDSLTPIVNAINSDNLEYFKSSGVLQIANCKFYHWSVFDDKAKYPSVKDDEGCVNIALFHGLVNNSTTEAGYVLHSDSMKAEMFDGFDMVLLGDIHKLQYLNENKTIAYPGSLIQQNHGEERDHGILVWDVDSRSAEYLKIENDTAFFTIEVNNGLYERLPSDLQKNLYLRVKYKNTDQSTIKSIVSEIKRDYNVIELSFQRLHDSFNRENSANNVKNTDFRSISKQRSLLYNYLHNKYKLDDRSMAKVYEINDRVNAELIKNEVPRNSMWLPKRFEFENMFSYGKDNHIDFVKMEGTYGIFAPNASGKSTLLDAITYCIFDKCTKSNRGHQVMNSSANTFYCKLEYELNGIDYFIERNARRQKNGNVRVEVDFYHLDSEGNKVSLNGKERSDTNNNIKNLLGSYEDFVLTTLSTQSNNTGFIDMNQKDRKDLLSQFLDIGVFEEMHNVASESTKETMAIVRHHQKNNYEEDLYEKQTELDTTKSHLEDATEEKNRVVKRRNELSDKCIDLATKLQDVDESIVDEKLLNDKLSEAESVLSDTQIAKQGLENKADNIKNNVDSVKQQIDATDEVQLDQLDKQKQSVEKEYNELRLDLKKLESDVFHKNKKMDNLKELEYDPNCSYCMNNVFVKDAINTKKELEQDLQAIDSLKGNIVEIEDKLKTYKDLDNKKKQLSGLKKLLNDHTKADLDNQKQLVTVNENIEKLKTGIQKIKQKLDDRNKSLKVIENNKKINEQLDKTKSELKSIDDELSKIDKSISDYNSKVSVLTASIEDTKKNVEEQKEYESQYLHYQYYLEATHRDGIPHDLIAITIPQIEEEVNNILSQLVDFRIVLQTDDKNVNAYIAYSEDKYWPIELTSGMEKFVSSLAIRTSLIGISTLPRPNFMAIDEGFGALDKSNLSSMAMLFDYLKTQFKFIMIISHIDSMRDIVDSHIEVNKVNGRSNVKHS
jgi:DNA repair exonuclease SbcCD ATPase subunit/predicted phosphohydrolase